MTPRGVLVADEQVSGLVVLTIYTPADLAVCSRILQVLTLRRVRVERFVADCSKFDCSEVRGLGSIREPVMRLSVVVSIEGDLELDQLTKYLNRVIGVYKVEHTFRV